MRSILVTGGTGVLGSAIVRRLCAGGFGVTANYRRDEDRAQRLQDETDCALQRADVGDEGDVLNLFHNLSSLWGVAHVAGVTHDALTLRQTREAWAETLRVNADGAFLVARCALQLLPVGGRLVLLASRVGEHGNAGQGAYAASKAAVIALMRCAAREGAERGIAVNAVCPGFVPSALSHDLPAPSRARLRAQVWPEDHVVQPETTIAATIAWLLSEDAAGITGQVIHPDSRI